MQPPWIILHLFLIPVSIVYSNEISNGPQGSEVENAVNATNSQKQVTEREKRLIPYKTYYLTQTRANANKESRGGFVLSTTPKSLLVPGIVQAVPNADHGQSESPQYNVFSRGVVRVSPRPLPYSASAVGVVEPKAYYDSGRGAPNFQVFRSIEPIPPINKQEITGHILPSPLVVPVQLVRLPPYSPQSFTKNGESHQPIRGLVSNLNFLTEPNNRLPQIEENIAVGERNTYEAVDGKKEPSSTDRNPKIPINAVTVLPSASRPFSLEPVTSTKFEEPKYSSGVVKSGRKESYNRDRVRGGSGAGVRVANRGHHAAPTRLKVPQENEIRLVVNLTPIKSSHDTGKILPFGNNQSNEARIQGNQEDSNKSTVAGFLSILKETTKLPKNLTPDNIDNGIKTLALILERLHKEKQIENIQSRFIPVVSPPRVSSGLVSPEQVSKLEPATLRKQQSFPQASGTSTPGRPGIDYPTYSSIPQTEFDCSTQRYKGFFGDPETKCQVWHYCDLNGGQASFLCPNGTIFSQVALTCDWWFNVKCASTSQLYVLNERLYKYILPFSPSFPEDYSGPVVDRYLTAKFNEMERKSKVKPLKSFSTTRASTPLPQSTTQSPSEH